MTETRIEPGMGWGVPVTDSMGTGVPIECGACPDFMFKESQYPIDGVRRDYEVCLLGGRSESSP